MTSEHDHLEIQKRADFQQVFSGEVGAKVLRQIALEACFFAPTHVPGQDPVEGWKAEGKRQLFLFIMQRLQEAEDPMLYLTMANQARFDYQPTPRKGA